MEEQYMRRALELAAGGIGRVNPNPLVGAVIVKDGRIIGEGYHERCGAAHAERNALASCSDSPAGGTMVVTLEPCCHQGRTSPCTDAILESGLARVVVGSSDPNPLVAGKGIAVLRAHGVEVTEGVFKEACDKQNEVFFHYIRSKTPYVVMKTAMSMDGKIATHSGKSRWITGEQARERVHADRNRYSAIMVGVGTVLEDDPSLTCRIPGGRNPLRIICDSNLRTPLTSQTVRTARDVRTLIATCCRQPERIHPYMDAGCEIVAIPPSGGRVDLNLLMHALNGRGIDSILLEGGATLNWEALRCGIVQKVQMYLAPKLLGGVNAKSPVGGQGIEDPKNAIVLSRPTITVLGDDVLLESEVMTCLRES